MAPKLEVGIGAEISGLTKGLADADKQLMDFARKVDKITDLGAKFTALGKQLTVGVTLPLVALGGASVKAFADLEGVKAAFDRLNDPTLLDGLRTATKNTTSDFELMKGAVQASNFGIPVKELATLMEFASRRAKDTGESVDYLVNSIVTGIGRKSPLILDNLGISSAALASELGGVSIQAARIGTVTEAVGRIASAELQKMGKDTLTLKEQYLQIKTILANSAVEIGSIIAKYMAPAIDVVKGLAERFQALSPAMKETIVIVGGLAAATGPLLVAIGSIMSALPLITIGIGGVVTAITVLTGGVGAAIIGIGLLVAAYVSYSNANKTALDYTKEWARSLDEANTTAYKQVTALDKLYQKTQDNTASAKNRKEAVDELQRQFPTYFASIEDEVILNGKAENSYKTLRTAIYEAARAKAAQAEIDKRATERLSTELKLRERYEKNVAILRNPKSSATQGLDPRSAPITRTAQQNQAMAARNILDINKELRGLRSEWAKSDEELNRIIEQGQKARESLIVNGGANTVVDIKTTGTNIAKAKDDVTKVIEKNELKPLVLVVPQFKTAISTQSVGQVVDEIMGRREQIAQGIVGGIESEHNAIEQAIQNQITSWEEMGERFLENSLFDFASDIGSALASGANALQVGGGALLGALGSFAQMFGKELINLGIQSQAFGALLAAIKTAIKNPFVLIAAGVAAVAIGSALTKAAGRSMNRINGGGGGSSYSGGGNVNTSFSGASPNYGSNYANNSNNSGFSGTVVFEIDGQKLVGVIDRTRQRNRRIGGQNEVL